jgi:hypothetical protein
MQFFYFRAMLIKSRRSWLSSDLAWGYHAWSIR